MPSSALLTSLAFSAKSVQKLLQELHGHGGVDLQRMFPLLLHRNADCWHQLSRVYRALVRSGSFRWARGKLISLQSLKDLRRLIQPFTDLSPLLLCCQRYLRNYWSVNFQSFWKRVMLYLPDSTHFGNDWDVAMHCRTYATRRRLPWKRVVS